jgi:hypothetical protein
MKNKTLILIISFIILIISFIIALSFIRCKKDSTVNQGDDYFPLQVGNYWEFKAFNGNPFKYQIDSIKNLEGKDYFRMLRSGFLISGTDTVYYRKDPASIVYERRRTTQEVLKVNLSVPVGTKWDYAIDSHSGHKWWASLGSKTDTVKCSNYTFENCYRYFYNVEETADEEYWWFLAPGVGIVKDMNASFPASRLTKAKINGVETEY